jgi:hypothetical protein
VAVYQGCVALLVLRGLLAELFEHCVGVVSLIIRLVSLCQGCDALCCTVWGCSSVSRCSSCVGVVCLVHGSWGHCVKVVEQCVVRLYHVSKCMYAGVL